MSATSMTDSTSANAVTTGNYLLALSLGRTARQDRADRAADSLGRMDDAALALIDLQLPQRQVRRIAL